MVKIAGIGPFANRGIEERNKRADAPGIYGYGRAIQVGILQTYQVRLRDRWRYLCGCCPHSRGRVDQHYRHRFNKRAIPGSNDIPDTSDQ